MNPWDMHLLQGKSFHGIIKRKKRISSLLFAENGTEYTLVL
jgi:hypothetical protein